MIVKIKADRSLVIIIYNKNKITINLIIVERKIGKLVDLFLNYCGIKLTVKRIVLIKYE